MQENPPSPAFEQKPLAIPPAEGSLPLPKPSSPTEPESLDKLLCPACGKPLDEGSGGPTTDDLQEYIRCLLGGRLFRKTYELYDGKLNLTFSALTSAEAENVYQQGQQFRMLLGEEEAQVQLTRVRLLYYLRSVGTTAYSPPKEGEDLDTLYAQRFQTAPDGLLTVEVNVLMHFLRLLTELAEKALDHRFWKGAGLV